MVMVLRWSAFPGAGSGENRELHGAFSQLEKHTASWVRAALLVPAEAGVSEASLSHYTEKPRME